ncbi:hypothetical protein [Klebsiella phage 05F01]|nr:hypothetical protein [Klebsiella phage 05F01]
MKILLALNFLSTLSLVILCIYVIYKEIATTMKEKRVRDLVKKCRR